MSSQDILNQIEKNNSAEELNKNTQSIYVLDLVYVVCKVFLFVVLGIIYVVFFKNAETMKDVIIDAKDNITQKIRPLIKTEVKDVEVTNKDPNP